MFELKGDVDPLATAKTLNSAHEVASDHRMRVCLLFAEQGILTALI
jgi:hypothetical protein